MVFMVLTLSYIRPIILPRPLLYEMTISPSKTSKVKELDLVIITNLIRTKHQSRLFSLRLGLVLVSSTFSRLKTPFVVT